VPELLQFFGVELNAPAADHASVIIPHSHEEADQVFELESRFDGAVGDGGGFAPDPLANTEERMLAALEFMEGFALKPVVIANHPSRTATGSDRYGRTTPAELRGWNDRAPDVAVGMAGAPGHQAAGIVLPLSEKRAGSRGQYGARPTQGGFDQMTAELGGFWDSMLGEGRRWWITANSDSHRNWSEGGNDFWPGEYSKTYVFAEKRYPAVLQSLRSGRVFVTTGDLVSELDFSASSGADSASTGGTLTVAAGDSIELSIRVRDPAGRNANSDNPAVRRVDLISGAINPRLVDAAVDVNPTTEVLARFEQQDWIRDGEVLTMSYTVEAVDRPRYFRVRGTSTAELEPADDFIGEDPWSDLWFYSNPVFIEIRNP
jgi:hypothetical protein